MARVHRDLLTGALLAGVGVFAIWTGYGLGTGTIRRMGPGFFPVMLGAILIALGALIAMFPGKAPVPGTESTTESAPANLRALVLICAAIAAFALLVRTAGLVPAVFAAVVLSSMADTAVQPLQSLAIATVMSALAVGVFVWGLGFQAAPFGRY